MEEFILSGYGDVIAIEPQADRDAYIIRNADGKVWELTAEQLYAGRKGTPMVRYLVTWRRQGDGLHYFGHTSKPTALGHVRGLQRDPRVLAVAIYPVTGEANQ